MPEITVILPSLNVAPYMDRCLKSVCAQSFQDLEILAVDAGSTDGTLDIIREYENRDKRVRLICSRRKSYGFQVNLGISEAKGAYLAVVETDDFIAEDMMETLYRTASLTGADYVKGDHDDVVMLPDGRLWSYTVNSLNYNRKLYHKVFAPTEYPELIRRDIYYWKGLYRKEFLDRTAIRMNESDGAAFQDAGFLFQTLSLAGKAVYLNRSVYRYRRGNTNASVFHPEGYRYLAQEYAYIEQKMSVCHKEEFHRIKPYYYTRLFDQFAGRTRTMAAQGVYWDGIEEAVRALWERLLDGYESGSLHAGTAGSSLFKEIVMFLNRPEDYFAYQMSIYNGKRRLLKDLLGRLEKCGQIVIYSCGGLARFAFCLLRRNNIRIDAFCENDMTKWHTTYLDTEILSVEESAERFPDAVFLIANNHYSPEMIKQLIRLGVPEKKICLFGLEYDLLLLNM